VFRAIQRGALTGSGDAALKSPSGSVVASLTA
jgi:hypothetical protein